MPGHFESVEEYVRVFEPLLFEECRAQLYSTYEELQENVTRDAHIVVRVKNVERRERGVHIALVLEIVKLFTSPFTVLFAIQKPNIRDATCKSRKFVFCFIGYDF